VGQEHVSITLKNAIDSGRVAHAFLFTGARGVGKTTSARILAKTLNCETGPTTEPCNVCQSCTEITAGNSVDVFEIDGASNTSVDDIRELRENIKYLPSKSRYKIFIIDEVHMLSTSAFNALLKTLEEPPLHVKFIFATTEPHKVPITILSRCQRFDFRRISLKAISERLRYITDQEKITISDAALNLIARKGDGSMRDSLSTLDQVLAFCGDVVNDDDVSSILGTADRRMLFKIADATISGDCSELLEQVRVADQVGLNMKQFLLELIDHFRNLLVAKIVPEPSALLELADAELVEITGQAKRAGLSDLQRHITILLKAENEISHSSFSRLVVESALIKMATLPPAIPAAELLARLREVEVKPGASIVATQNPSWRPSPPPTDQSLRDPLPVRKPFAEKVVSAPEAPQVDDPGPSTVLPSTPDELWRSFVEFVKGKKPLLAHHLEAASPLAVSAEKLDLGLKKGSFEFTSLSAGDARETLQNLAKQYFGTPAPVTITPLLDDGGAPRSLAEKKSSEAEARRMSLQQDAREHPAVRAAVEIFSGEIEDIQEL
jgi:DNA polymerase-3 subunit gamma/tau